MQPDEDSLAPDDSVLPPLLQGDKADCASICSMESTLSIDLSRQRSKRGIRYAGHGSVLRQVVLRSISAQITSAAERVDAGKPTALCVSSLVAVGSSHGLVLIFDSSQVMKWCLESKREDFGAVSAMCFNRDSTRLLVGFANGQITMWDLNNGKLLRTITDVHPPGTAILHVKFTDDLTLAVCSDSGGSVYELEFKRLMGVRSCESKCLFSGSRGEVCVIEPLHVYHMPDDNPLKDVVILAMCSLSKVLLVTVKPELSVIFVHPLKGDPATLPLVAWQFVVIEEPGQKRTIQPVLAFARDQTIFFYQVGCEGPYDITCFRLQKTEVAYKLLALTWLNSRTMVAVDTSERAHVIDVRSSEELEVIDLSDIQLVFGSSFYKSLSTGGNVSQALAYAGKRACYYSLVLHMNQLVLLGTHSVQVLTLRKWTERVDLLARQGKYQEALALALSFYEGRAKAVVGLIGGPERRMDIVAQKIESLLDTYVTAAMTSLCPTQGKVEELEAHYRAVVPICVDCCLRIRKLDMLFGWIYDKFCSDAIARVTFLESLEPYILSDQLTYIAPSVMKDFVEHHQQRELLQTVEQCIVHLDITSLDIHQVCILIYNKLICFFQHAMYISFQIGMCSGIRVMWCLYTIKYYIYILCI
ncbi:hypothetical protein NP493_140g01014 [Ridgeia piscesae]|uniref:Vacuolar protein sorting-associated protein 8 central domain-containing protein n=1 Tax=Ridgeia piscesae TaxID=27915 RepID=A0AAD9P4W3_RIDPI|nr:hypothetical protein NP493_140g01014 [Ridgeia piscesae]